MRVLLFRLLISWWMIPSVFVMFFPISFLMSGYEYAVNESKDLLKDLWNGFE